MSTNSISRFNGQEDSPTRSNAPSRQQSGEGFPNQRSSIMHDPAKPRNNVSNKPNRISIIDASPKGSRPHMRPGLSSRATSFAHSMASSRRSMARSMSTLSAASMYGNFAGERLEDHHHQPRMRQLSDEEKRKSTISRTSGVTADGKQEESSLGLAEEEVVISDEPKASVGKAMFMFLKAFLGSGVLFLPKAFDNGGLALSIVLMVVIAVICLFAFLQLVKAQQVVGGSYGDVGGVLYGSILRYIVLFFITISQIGFVCSYLIFISGNLVNVADVLSHHRATIEEKYYIWMPLVIIIPMALIRHIARLSLAAIVADIFILFGLISIIYFTSYDLHNYGIGPGIAAVNSASFGMMIGTATFSFEGIGLVIPIVESMERPERYKFVITVGMLIVAVIYILIGTLSYLAYGKNIQAAVIYNFPAEHGLTIAVDLLYSVAIILTAPLMLFPALKILEHAIFYKCRSGRDSLAVKWGKNLYRAILAIACAGIAFGVGGDNLDKFVSLIGSIACVPLCFIFPGMFHFKIANSWKSKIADICLVIWGVGIMVYTLYVTIDSFIHPPPA